MPEDYVMPVRAIKNILKKELQDHRDGLYAISANGVILTDCQKEMIRFAHVKMQSALSFCTSYDDLEKFLSFAGYRMSLTEWIQSL